MRRAKLLGAFGICGELFDSLKIVQLQFSLQLILSGQIGKVFGCKNLVVVFRQGVLDDGITLVSAENNADGWIITLVHQLTSVVVHIHLHLADMRKSWW